MLSDTLRLVRNHAAQLHAPHSHMPGNPAHSSPIKSSLSCANSRSTSRSRLKEKWVTSPIKKRSVSFSGVEDEDKLEESGHVTDETETDDDDLVWDSFSQIDEDPTRLWSTKTLWSGNMAPPSAKLALELTKHKGNIDKINEIIEDDLDIPDPKRLPPQLLQKRFDLAEESKASFRESLDYIKLHDADYFSTIKDDADAKKGKLRDIVKSLQTRIEELYIDSPEDNTAANKKSVQTDPDVERYKTKKIHSQLPTMISRMKSLEETFERISGQEVEDDQQFFEVEEELKATRERANVVIRDVESLINDAIDVKMVNEASQMTEAVYNIKRTMDDCIATNVALKASFGLMGGSKDSKVINVKIPTFSGKKNDTDFLTFKKRYQEYCGLVKMSNQNQLLLLKNDCITDSNLRASIDRFETPTEILNYLTERYGDIESVLWRKKEDLWRLGPMPKGERGKPGLAEKRRDWTAAVEAKLRELHHLAEYHGLEQKFYYSGIAIQIESLLPVSMAEDYQRQLRKEKDRSDAEKQFKLLQKFLCDLVDTFTFQMNRESANIHHIKSMYASQAVNFGKEHTDDEDSVKDSNTKARPGSNRSNRQSHQRKKGGSGSAPDNTSKVAMQDCPLECGERHSHIFYCEKFQEEKYFRKRFSMCAENRICMRCLRLDSDVDFKNRELWWDNHEQQCITDFACVAESCAKRKSKAQCHILICKIHYGANKSREDDFKNSLNKKIKSSLFTMFHNAAPEVELIDGLSDKTEDCVPDVAARAIFMVHSITVGKKDLLLFYDTGAISACISQKAYQAMETRNVKIGPTTLAVAGGELVTVPGGHEQVTVELADRRKAKVTALHLPEITVPFPTWELQKAWQEVVKYAGDIDFKEKLPQCAKSVGGKAVDVLIGIKYLSLHPRELFVLPCGLGVYKARIRCTKDEQAVLGGPHHEWEKAFQLSSALSPMAFLSCEARAYFFQQKSLKHVISSKDVMEDDIDNHDDDSLASAIEQPEGDEDYDPVCGNPDCVAECLMLSHNNVLNIKHELSDAEMADKIGSDVSYRCLRCRSCNNCKKGDQLEAVSLKEELEQAMIEEGVVLDAERKKLVTSLPFIKSPEENLSPNRHIAFKVLETQEKQCAKNPNMAADLENAHEKLRSRGFVCKVEELTAGERKMINESAGSSYYIPWRSVYKESSITTPVRLVFDASARTPNKESLNGILATGRNNLADLYQLLLRFRFKKYGLSADITMAYNQIEIKPSFYKYQLYLWKEGMKSNEKVVEMVIKTLIYGVRPSGNITIAGFNKIAEFVTENHPEHKEGADALKKDAYMDDLASGTNKENGIESLASSITNTLSFGSMAVKAYTFSGRPPPAEVSTDGETVGLLGYSWSSQKDLLSLADKEVYLEKAKRGKLSEPLIDDVEANLLKRFTKRTITRIVAAVFDPLGLATAVTAGFKLDLHDIVQLNLDWDDKIPEKYLLKWVQNVDKIREIRQIHFRRAVIPVDAVSTNVELIVSTDASEKIAIATVHASFLRKNGQRSVQLVTAKSKLVTTSTIPRAELKAAKVGASLGYVASVNAGNVGKILYVTDSVIVLHWIGQDERPLQTAVRNAVIEIRRLTKLEDWHHIPGELNIADLGTRQVTTEEISEDSAWQQGPEWMYLKYDDMPIRSIKTIKLTDQEKSSADKETKKQTSNMQEMDELMAAKETEVTSKLAERYKFSSYFPDPACLSWPKVLRCRAAIMRFVFNLRKRKEIRKRGEKINPKSIQFSEDEIQRAEKYFYIKATLEVKHFNEAKKWKDCTDEMDGILIYKARVVDGMVIEQADEDIFNDINPLTFCKPVVDRWSPIAYNLMKTAHEDEVCHRNASATLLASRYSAFILQGKNLADTIVEKCPSCIKRKAKLFEAEMAKIHQNRLTVAPPFYFSQVDLFGPYSATCEHNHRATVKVWGLVFKCTTTTAVSVHALQKYDSDAFLSALIRMGEKRGYPKKLFIDAGSQLVKTCKEANIAYLDLLQPAQTRFEIGLEHEICPVSGHNMNGMAERSIREIKKIFDRVYGGIKLDLLNYETAFAFISNELNSLPIYLNSDNSSRIDIITPARLLYGRNNKRAPIGTARLAKPSRLMEQLDKVKEAWWGVWKAELLNEFIPGNSKWTETKQQPAVGDVVIFLKQGMDNQIGGNIWHYAIVDELIASSDGIIRRVIIKYKNYNEKVFQYSNRHARSVAFLLNERQCGILKQLDLARKLGTPG